MKRKKWIYRTVKNGRVKAYGRYYVPPYTTMPPAEGERILFSAIEYPGTMGWYVSEHDGPVEADGFIRRIFWNEYKEDFK